MPNLIESLTQIIPEHLHAEVARELANGWRLEEVKARHTAAQIGKFNKQHSARSVEGLGQKVASIPLDAYHYWAHTEGRECWSDKQFVREFLRDNPDLAVTRREKKTMVGGAKGLLDHTGNPIS